MPHDLTAARSVALLAMLALLAGAARADDSEFSPVVPYRPTVSDPAQLSAPGQLELEMGGLAQRNADGSRQSLPYLLKLAVNDQWGFLLGGEAWVRQHDSDGRTQGIGDTSLGLKGAWTVSDHTAFGAEFLVKLPSAKDSIGSGRSDQTLNGIYSQDMGPIHMDLNLNATRVGRTDPGTGRFQTGASASFSTPITDKFGVTAEWSGNRRSGTDSQSQLLAAVTYSPSKFLTVDLGVAHAMHPSPSTMQWFTGLVVPLAKFW